MEHLLSVWGRGIQQAMREEVERVLYGLLRTSQTPGQFAGEKISVMVVSHDPGK